MKLFQVLTIIALALLTISCASISGGGGDKISELKIPAKQVEAGACVFGAKTTQHATVTTRSDCTLRGGAFSLDVQTNQNESVAEVL